MLRHLSESCQSGTENLSPDFDTGFVGKITGTTTEQVVGVSCSGDDGDNHG
jgi:hypothetical protein